MWLSWSATSFYPRTLAMVGGPERSGIPKLSDHKRDTPCLFLDKLHAAVRCGSTMTSFFIQRSTYFAFFGRQLSIDIVDVNAMHEGSTSTAEVIDPPRSDPRHERAVRCQSRSEPMITEEADQQGRLETLKRMAEEQEARLEELAQRERDQEEIIARLQNAASEQEEKITASRRDDQELQEKLDGMRRAEAGDQTREPESRRRQATYDSWLAGAEAAQPR
jgi:hypothetical protein